MLIRAAIASPCVAATVAAVDIVREGNEVADQTKITYSQLLERVKRTANALKNLGGCGRGDMEGGTCISKARVGEVGRWRGAERG